MKGTLVANDGKPTIYGPGKVVDLNLNPYRKDRRVQELAFELAGDLAREYAAAESAAAPRHVLFPQMLAIVDRFLREKLDVHAPAEVIDVFVSPYYGHVLETLGEAVRPDTEQGEAPELPSYETNRGPITTAEVEFWTSRDVREVERSHLNYMVADTKVWEQSAAYVIDKHPAVAAFVKNEGMGFAIPYIHDNEAHDYMPDFVIRLDGEEGKHLILETKGYDTKRDAKVAAAERWVAAVNAEGSYGEWQYAIAEKLEQVSRMVWQAT